MRKGIHLKRLSITLGALIGAGLLAGCGQGQDTAATDTAPAAAPAEGAAEIIKARQENLKKFGAANKAMQDELKKGEPALAVYQANAPAIAQLAPELHTWFPAGTGVEAGVKTAAKAEIWAQPDDFKAKADAFVAVAQKFDATVKAGDMTAITAGAEELGLACRNCHQTYRQRDE